MNRTILATALALTAAPALAEIERMEAQGSVDDAFSRLENAVESAGATIFATVDHGSGAADAGMELNASKLLIFGNPQLGTPVMQEDMLAGLVLPLKMLVYSDGDQTYVAYEEIEESLDDLDVDDDLEVLEKIEGALQNFATAAVGN
ncbi:hypothetical protein PARPLA_02888 [Rhodobacteraceae bacterium THAF1]|uniref:DUF302 domain-containing protein n=1 Tax=Palleronia sp. THAF1 TaxID=2587842 RepID=UPI000F3FFC6B|nr:DUF302 domain-containing protein [Palleronia sp. THAF1]QFU08290.1 hypothetical protein FIU81_06350 [Palleronia sp. THAF1]VDC28895.1 hypothetical protein PARPLA_02888 [Rhodobacteraceae bacterium THAF1]